MKKEKLYKISEVAEMFGIHEDTLRNWEKEGLEELNVFCAGSFFNDDELPPEVRASTFETAKNLAGIRKVMVESRPEYITSEKIEKAIEILGPDIEFEVAIGLESSSTRVRDDIINKGFGLKEFEESLRVIGKTSASLLVYILLKPPGISEKEAYFDTLDTTEYVFKQGREHAITKVTAAIQPAFVQREGYLHDIYVEGNYRPPWLWTIVKLINKVHSFGEIQIGTSDDYPPPIAIRANCPLCNDDFEKAVDTYNRTQDATVFEGLQCQCQKKWTRETGIKFTE